MTDAAPPAWIRSPAQRGAAARDLWMGNAVETLRGATLPRAAAVVRPASTAQLAAALAALRTGGGGVVPLGAGSGVCAAVRAGDGDTVIDLKALRDIAIDPAAGIGRFGAGVLGSHAEAASQAQGMTIGHFPSSIATSTVGGWLAARGAGQLSSRYGKIEDIAVGATAVTLDGRVIRARRGDADLGAWIGSEGALAVLTEVELRLWPRADGWTLRGVHAPNLDAALALARTLVRARPVPSVIRVYDPVDSRIALSHGRGGLMKRLPLMLRAPHLVHAVMRHAWHKCLVVFGWEGQTAATAAALDAGLEAATAAGCRDLGAGPGELWLHRRHDVSFKAIGVLRDGLFADTLEIAAPWSRVAAAYHAVRRAVLPDALAMAHFSHAWSEGCAIYVSMSGRVEGYAGVWQRALEAAHDHGAAVSHHHGIGRLKAAALPAELGGAWPALQALKDAWDPGGQLNPGVLGLGSGGTAPEMLSYPVTPLPVAPHAWATSPTPTAAQAEVAGDANTGGANARGAIDDANGLWIGPLAAHLADVERDARAAGWSLGVGLEGELRVGDWLRRDLVAPAATALGSARDRVVALAGTTGDAAPYATRIAPRHATGPDLRPTLLSWAGTDRVCLRLQRRPAQFLRMEGSGDPKLLCRRLWGQVEPWAIVYARGTLRVWLPWQTAADQAAGAPVRMAWAQQVEGAASALAEPDELLRLARWAPWAEHADAALLVGCEPAGAWRVQEG